MADTTLKTAFEWAELVGIVIIDADGWRFDKKSMNELISRDEFNWRMCMSTVTIPEMP